MNNIQKSFKKKSELRCMADGGVVDHMSGKSREQQLREATGDSIPAKAPGPGQPDFRNVQSSVKSTEAMKGEKPKSALQRLFGMADGGEAPDGEIKGPGGPTDDKVGPVMLSDGEYVLPADTVKAIGKDKLDAIREATHKFVDSDDDGMANGGFFDDVTKRAKEGLSALRSAVTPAPAAPAPTPVRVNPGAGVSPRTPVGTGMMTNTPPGQSMVPYQAGEAAKAPGALGRAAGAVGTGIRGLGTLAAGAAPLVMNRTDTQDQRIAAGGGMTGTSKFDAAGNAAGQGGAYIGSAASGYMLSPRDIGGITSSLRQTFAGNMSGPENMAAWNSVPREERGWARRGVESLQRGLGLAPELPDFSTVKGGSQTSYGQPGATPVADATRGTGSPMANEKPPSGPQYYADLERLHQQELKALAGGNREAGARAAVGGGTGAEGYPGLIENRSGVPNSVLAAADPDSYYAQRADGDIVGSFNGRNITKKEADARAAGLGGASGQAMKPEGDPAMAEIRSALRGIGGGGGGNWAPRSQADEINARYDSLMRGGSGQNRVKGSDWSQRHGLDVEMARAKELGADASNQSTLRGQNMSAGAAADQTRMSGINKMMELQAEREKAGAMGQAAATKAQQDAMENAAKANQQGYENFTKAAEQMFVGPEGKPDPAQQQQFMDFVSATDPKILEEGAGVSSVKDLFDLAPQEQMNAVQRLKTMMSMQAAANKSIGNATMLNNGPQQTGFDAPLGDAREGTWGDMASGKLSMGQWLYGNLPFTEKNVQPLSSGGVVPIDEYVGNSADAEKVRLENIRNKLKYNNQ